MHGLSQDKRKQLKEVGAEEIEAALKEFGGTPEELAEAITESEGDAEISARSIYRYRNEETVMEPSCAVAIENIVGREMIQYWRALKS